MKWIGQHVYDLISRFRSDVYLEDISTGTIASGGNLGLDSNNKIVKAAEAAGDIEGVTAGVGLSGGGSSGTVSLAVDFSEFASVVPADGDKLATLDSDGSTEQLTDVRRLADLFAGTGLTASSSVIGVDASQTQITSVGVIGTGEWRGTAIDGAYIADDEIDSQHYVDGSIDTAHIADDQVTFAKASGVVPRVYGSIIKLLPTDFEANEDGGATKTMQFDDTGTTGLKPGNADTELLAFVSIPEGMKATHVDIYAAQNLTMECFELDIDASGLTSKGSGTTNTTLDITDVNATATNYLMIIVTTVATSNRVWGGKVTIAAQ